MHSIEMGLGAVMEYGKVKAGMRTLVDPFDAAIRANSTDWEKNVKV